MNELTRIIETVRARGSYEHDWLPLINTRFRGDDCFEKIEAWAAENGMKVMFYEAHKICRFYIDPAAEDRAIPDRTVR